MSGYPAFTSGGVRTQPGDFGGYIPHPSQRSLFDDTASDWRSPSFTPAEKHVAAIAMHAAARASLARANRVRGGQRRVEQRYALIWLNQTRRALWRAADALPRFELQRAA